MKNIKNSILGFVLFFLTVAFNSSLAVIVYSLIKDRQDSFVAVIILLFILCSSILCAIIDYLRRKFTIDKPVFEIRQATQKMAKGNFKIKLHTKNNTEYDLIKKDLNVLAEELSKNEVLKNDFIANISHEIKTPLAVIQNYAEALENTSLDEATQRLYLDNLQQACKKLTNLVTNILKLNKLENGRLLPENKEFNLSEAVAEQIISFEDLISKKQIELICEIEPDIFIYNEESYLNIIWSNLISNSIKFTKEKGEIKITLSTAKDMVIFKIEDNGCGMDKETGKHIFDKFYQGDTSHSKEGNGLGLALVKRVIDIIGGQIEVESEPSKGTKFVVSIKNSKGE